MFSLFRLTYPCPSPCGCYCGCMCIEEKDKNALPCSYFNLPDDVVENKRRENMTNCRRWSHDSIPNHSVIPMHEKEFILEARMSLSNAIVTKAKIPAGELPNFTECLNVIENPEAKTFRSIRIACEESLDDWENAIRNWTKAKDLVNIVVDFY